ncbi:MAG: hypothetical protein K6T83_16535 [Alicyclobacillus sp.]|nr:hypothetical protein [Alicyclobacillus sp.]
MKRFIWIGLTVASVSTLAGGVGIAWANGNSVAIPVTVNGHTPTASDLAQVHRFQLSPENVRQLHRLQPGQSVTVTIGGKTMVLTYEGKGTPTP